MKRIWALTRRTFLGGVATVTAQQALANGLMLARQPTGGGGTLDFSAGAAGANTVLIAAIGA